MKAEIEVMEPKFSRHSRVATVWDEEDGDRLSDRDAEDRGRKRIRPQ